MQINAGDKFDRSYPFRLVASPSNDGGMVGVDDVWVGGCHRETEWDEHGCSIVDHYANGVGKIEYEILAIAEMPRSYQTRVIYMVTMTDPDGGVRKINKAHMVTLGKFMKWVGGDDAYHSEYTVL